MTKTKKIVALFLVLAIAQATAILSGHAYDGSSNKTQQNQMLKESEKDKNGNVKPTPAPSLDGAALYTQHCVQCHGQSKRGKSAAAIQNAIKTVSYMGSLVLSAEQINAIASSDWPANLKKGSAGIGTKSPKSQYN
jgi:cytochrome c5